jgi:hypothetical protein
MTCNRMIQIAAIDGVHRYDNANRENILDSVL